MGPGCFILFGPIIPETYDSSGGRLQDMPLLLRKFKLPNGLMQEERIDDQARIDRYLRLFEKEDVKKLQTGKWVWIEKDEWQLIPD
jgi:hypothetical protein